MQSAPGRTRTVDWRFGFLQVVALYYLQHKNDKATFVQEWWNVVNWADVDARYHRARTQAAGLIVP